VLTHVKSKLRVRDTLVPLIIMSDGTHFWKLADDKTEQPVYLTIGNLSSKIRQMPSTESGVMVAVLRIPFKNRNIPQNWLAELRHSNREVLN